MSRADDDEYPPVCRYCGGPEAARRSSAATLRNDLGNAIEGDVVDRFDTLEYVPDGEAEWHDGRTFDLLEPGEALPFGGIAIVEPPFVVEIKTTQ